MKRERAIDRLLEDFRAGENWRGAFERLYDRYTDCAESIDIETYEALKQSIRNL